MNTFWASIQPNPLDYKKGYFGEKTGFTEFNLPEDGRVELTIKHDVLKG